MNRINIWILSIGILCFLPSCDGGFLEKAPQSSLSTETAFADMSLATAALYGTYSPLNSGSWYGRNFPVIGDIASDNTKIRPVNSGRFLRDYFYSKDRDNTQAGMWQACYQTINRANSLIEAVDGGKIGNGTVAEQNQLKAEAYFLRALAHFDLTRLFAQDYAYTAGGSHMGVPIVLEEDIFGAPSRNTVAQVYDAVIGDLATAASFMTDDLIPAGELAYRANSNTVNALLARVYLYKQDYPNAKIKAEEVINSGDYSLLTNGSYISAWAQAENSESILDAALTSADNLGVEGLGPIYTPEGYGDIAPTDGLLDLYDITDVRTGWFQVVNGDLYIYKYPNSQQNNTRILRLSDMYLISAEASGNIGTAAEVTAGTNRLNEIRTRAGLGAVAPNNVVELLTEVALERRRELAFEGHRWFDLRRNQQSIERGGDCAAPGFCSIPYPNDQFAYPIPQGEINANPNMVQNPGPY